MMFEMNSDDMEIAWFMELVEISCEWPIIFPLATDSSLAAV